MRRIQHGLSGLIGAMLLLPLSARALELPKQMLIGQYHTAAKSHALYAACNIDGTPEMQAMRAYGVYIGMSTNQLDVSEQLLMTYRDIYLQQLQHSHFQCTAAHQAKFQQDTDRITAQFRQMSQAP